MIVFIELTRLPSQHVRLPPPPNWSIPRQGSGDGSQGHEPGSVGLTSPETPVCGAIIPTKPKNHFGIAGRKKGNAVARTQLAGAVLGGTGAPPNRRYTVGRRCGSHPTGRVVVPRAPLWGTTTASRLSSREKHAVPRHSPAGRGPRPPQKGTPHAVHRGILPPPGAPAPDR